MSNPSGVGFENSDFLQGVINCDDIIKHIINKYEKIYKDIPITMQQKTKNADLLENKRVFTFYSDFKTCCNNLLGICGMELAYNLTFHINRRKIIRKLIKLLEKAPTYEEILNCFTLIRNSFNNKHITVKNSDFQTFDELRLDTEKNNNIFFNINADITETNIFDAIEKHIKYNLINRNNTDFNKNRELYAKQLWEYEKAAIFEPIEITQMDELLIAVQNKIGYEGWYLKLWSLLYDETFTDLISAYSFKDKPSEARSHKPAEQQNEEFKFFAQYVENPLLIYMDELKMHAEYNNYILMFINYFNGVIEDTQRHNESKHKTPVNVSANFLNYLANVVLNLFICLAKGIYNLHRYNITFFKNNRINFSLVLLCLTTYCRPRLYDYDKSQYFALYSLLLPKKD